MLSVFGKEKISCVMPATGGNESAPDGPVILEIILDAAPVGPVNDPSFSKNAKKFVISVFVMCFCVLMGEKM